MCFCLCAQTPSPGNSTRHIEIDLAGTGLHYGTADDLAVLPDNSPSSVAQLAKWLGYEGDLDRWFILEKAEGVTVRSTLARAHTHSHLRTLTHAYSRTHSYSYPHVLTVSCGCVLQDAKSLFPTPCTVRTALTSYVDIHGHPRKQLLSYFSVLASNSAEVRACVRVCVLDYLCVYDPVRPPLQKQRLQLLSSREGKEEYQRWVVDEQRAIWEVFQVHFAQSIA